MRLSQITNVQSANNREGSVMLNLTVSRDFKIINIQELDGNFVDPLDEVAKILARSFVNDWENKEIKKEVSHE